MAMGDDPKALEFPYLEIEEFSFSTDCLEVVKVGEKLKLEKKKRKIEPEKFFEKEDAYAKRKREKREDLNLMKEELNKKLQEDNLSMRDIVNFINKLT